jgi:hypothetical protein
MLSTAYPILEIIGEALPRDPSDKAARVEFKRVIALPETLTDDDILNLPSIDKYPLKDFCIVVCASIYQGLMHSHSSAVRVSFAYRMMDFTLKYGLGGLLLQLWAVSSSAFYQNCFETRAAARVGTLVLRVQEKLGRKSKHEAGVRVLAVTMFTWHKSLSHSVGYLLDTYRIGMRRGEVTMAFVSIVGYVQFSSRVCCFQGRVSRH